jgi:C-terminal processing protease CtpA/Prc
VFPDMAGKLGKMLRAKQKAGDFDRIDSAQQLAATLTEELRRSSGDKHLTVEFSKAAVPLQEPGAKPDPAEVARAEAEALKFFKSINFGINKVERLPGNIGYLDLRGFVPARLGGQAYSAAMTLLNGTDALIIDLRNNGGGDPSAVALLASYFFNERTQLSDIISREGGTTSLRQMSTSDYVQGPRYASGKDVIILTSKSTFSAGEDFSYSLQALKRASTMGETTGGGAHPGNMERLHAHFLAFIPFGRSLNPITKTDWEGVGVIPDVKMPAKDALKGAQALLLQKLSAAEADPESKQHLLQQLMELNGAP